MTQKTLKDLIEAHNLLLQIKVSGASVVPLAQSLVTMQAIINEAGNELRSATYENGGQ